MPTRQFAPSWPAMAPALIPAAAGPARAVSGPSETAPVGQSSRRSCAPTRELMLPGRPDMSSINRLACRLG